MKRRREPLFLGNYIRHDLRMGILAGWPKYLLAAAIFLVCCADLFFNHINFPYSDLPPYDIEPFLTCGDYLFFMFRGMKPYTANANEIFIVNAYWVLIHLYLAFIVSFYPFRDLNGYGQLMLLQSKKRSGWWLSKCIWNTFSVVTYYALMYVVIFLFTLCTGGGLTLVPSPNIQYAYSGLTVSAIETTPQEVMMTAMLIPLLVSIGLCLLQMLVALILRPLAGIILSAILLGASIFLNIPLLPGNYLMILRSELENPGNGIGLTGALFFFVLFSALAVFGGATVFSRHDILSKSK